jgi:hypothetical protein
MKGIRESQQFRWHAVGLASEAALGQRLQQRVLGNGVVEPGHSVAPQNHGHLALAMGATSALATVVSTA